MNTYTNVYFERFAAINSHFFSVEFLTSLTNDRIFRSSLRVSTRFNLSKHSTISQKKKKSKNDDHKHLTFHKRLYNVSQPFFEKLLQRIF